MNTNLQSLCAALKFVSWFTSGNSVPVGLHSLIRNQGPGLIEEAALVRDLLSTEINRLSIPDVTT